MKHHTTHTRALSWGLHLQKLGSNTMLPILAVLAVCILAFLVFTASSSFQQGNLLFVSTVFDNETRGSVSVVHLSDGRIEKLPLHAEGCDAFARDPKNQKIRISCRFGDTPLVTYDPRDSEVAKSALDIAHTPTFRTSLACSRKGKCYYGFGFMLLNEESRGRLVVTKNNSVIKSVFLPPFSEYVIPTKLVISGDMLYVLARGETGHQSVIFRLDPTSDEFVGDPIQIGAEAWDMDVSGNQIAVSVFRPTLGSDVLVLNSSTGERLTALMTGGSWPSWNAFGVAFSDQMLYVAGVGGVTAFSRNDWKQVATVPTPDFAHNVVTGNGVIYVTVPNAAKIYELDGNTLAIRREFNVNVEFGAIASIP